MALDIRYDADGCEGTLLRMEDTAMPSTRTLGAWALAVAGVCVVAALMTPLLEESVLMTLVLASGLFGAAWVAVPDGPASPLAWEAAVRPVQERFRVRQGQLTLWSEEGEQTVPLAGARITAFHDGVWVNPALGKPVRMSWDGATKGDVQQLADALTRAAQGAVGQRGTRHDVPRSLERMTEGPKS